MEIMPCKCSLPPSQLARQKHLVSFYKTPMLGPSSRDSALTGCGVGGGQVCILKAPQLFLMHNHSGEHGSLEGRAGSTANPRVRTARARCCAYNSAWGLEGFLGELRPKAMNHHALGPGTGRGKGGEDSRRCEQHSSRPRVKMGTGRGCHPHKGFEPCPGALGSRGGKSLRLHLRNLLQL